MYIICYPFNSQLLDFVNLLAQTSEHDHLPEHWHHKNRLDAENATTVEPFKWGYGILPIASNDAKLVPDVVLAAGCTTPISALLTCATFREFQA